MPAAQYLSSSYYERHLFTVELNLVERGVLTPEEIEARVQRLRENPTAQTRTQNPELAQRVVQARRASEPLPPPDASHARFQPGDRVRARNVHPTGHTRLPRYVRGKVGVIHAFHGVETLPDANAHGRGPSPEPLYSVRFDAAELWDGAADGPGCVYIDLWESYLEGA
jgi:nitrile hydratase beta subunit